MDNILAPKKSEILQITPQTDIEWLFKVKTDIQAECGQFLQVSIPKVGEAPISLAAYNRAEGWIEFLIRQVGRVTDAVFKLKAGDSFFLRGAYGTAFPIDAYKGKEMIIVSGGSGLAPVRPLINMMMSLQPEKTSLIMGFKDINSILFQEDIERWKSQGKVILTVDKCENPREGLRVGLVTEFIASVLEGKDLSSVQAVVVGPPIMMKFATQAFAQNGLTDEQIWVSFERNMSCAVGKCGHCKIDDTYICLEGPVFSYVKAKTLMD